MNYCEECGAKLQEVMEFYGSPIPVNEAVEAPKQEKTVETEPSY